jgi:hypothetical protein
MQTKINLAKQLLVQASQTKFRRNLWQGNMLQPVFISYSLWKRHLQGFTLTDTFLMRVYCSAGRKVSSDSVVKATRLNGSSGLRHAEKWKEKNCREVTEILTDRSAYFILPPRSLLLRTVTPVISLRLQHPAKQ